VKKSIKLTLKFHFKSSLIGKLLKLYFHDIFFVNFYFSEDKAELRVKEKQGSEQCTGRLLDMIQEKDTPGGWQVFVDALNKSGKQAYVQVKGI